MTTERQYTLLTTLVREYINRDHPISSKRLTRLATVAFSPATVRHDLSNLEEEGYIYQPHTSAGRIPTDRGYRYYVDHMSLRALSPLHQRYVGTSLRADQQRYRQPVRAIAKTLARYVHSCVLSSIVDSREVYEAGMVEMLQQTAKADHDILQEISKVLTKIDRHLLDLYESERDQLRIYIGQENPLFKACYTSLLIRTVTTASGRRSMLVVVGPKRMPYQRNIAILNAVATLLKQM